MSKARIILGLMTFGPDTDKGARVTDVEDLKKALDVFKEYGYDEVDTARIYVGGLQEGYTRKAGWKERGLTLATKVYPVTPGIHKPATITEYFETSLKELGSDSVDVSGNIGTNLVLAPNTDFCFSCPRSSTSTLL